MTESMYKYDVGALVRVRGREWVVLPDSAGTADDPDMLMLRPLGGTEDEITGIYLPLEQPEPAHFDLPDVIADMGNQLSCGLLRDAVRLGFRSGAGPFRSLARIAVEPRPYQLVPLLMALKLDPVRLLIADDVGIGKTIEACLVARELIDRGEVGRLAVLCPPHLAEQWQQALAHEFHIHAELVLSGTAARLERSCRRDQSLFERYPFTVVSTDYIKSERRRHEFLRTCPELVIVDEAHTCAASAGRSASQQRHELLQALVDADPANKHNGRERHLILVTATPHSGKEETFRSLLSLLDRDLLTLPEDLSGDGNRRHRETLARYFVQRRRGDLKAYLDTVTPFPEREIAEEHYTLRPAYRRFLDKVLAYCRETVLDESLEKRRQRIRWWSALALLRALSSSPAAAAATLRNRSSSAEGATVDEVDEEGRRAVLDLDDENFEGIDVIPGSVPDNANDNDNDNTNGSSSSERRRLNDLARDAEALQGRDDAKLARALELIRDFLAAGYAPLVFCRFIPTVTYVAEFLRHKLEPEGVVVEAITGSLPPEERERRVRALGARPRRVLVCTDCLSEGINLQHDFNAVMHYDLSWNPTRHEQREGRVDRYGQPRGTVRTLTLYGQDNPVDGIVLQVLLRKHKAIHRRLGITVPVPMDTRVIEDAILEGLLLRDHPGNRQLDILDILEPIHRPVDIQWDAAVEREKRSRTLFAQNQMLDAVNTEVRAELDEVRRVLGDAADVRRFTATALRSLGAVVSGDKGPGKGKADNDKGKDNDKDNGNGMDSVIEVDVREAPRALKDAIGHDERFSAVFAGQPSASRLLLTRTHPVVEGLAGYVLESALDRDVAGHRAGPASVSGPEASHQASPVSRQMSSPGKRCGVIRTAAVSVRTTVILVRIRLHIINQGRDGKQRSLLAEDLALVGFTGSPERAEWLAPEQVEPLLEAEARANIDPGQAENALRRILDRFDAVRPHLAEVANARGQALFDAHRRVRKATRTGVRALEVDVHQPADVLGVYLYLPAGQDAGQAAGQDAGQKGEP